MNNILKINLALLISVCSLSVLLNGCGGYSSESLYPDDVTTVYVEMFDSRSFRRGVEYELTNAIAKRIETNTQYKVVSSRDRADTILSGQIENIEQSVLTSERQTGRAIEKDIELKAVVSWKNLKTGKLLLDNMSVNSRASFSEWQSQGFDYGATLAANILAERIVELMEKQW